MKRELVVAWGESGNISFPLAQDLIRSSTFWIDHPQGITHPEPVWADRIDKGPHGYEVRFGGARGNKFLIEHAILLSKETLVDEVDRSQQLNQTIDPKLLLRRLITCVRKSVADYSDAIFDYYTGGVAPSQKSKGFYTDESFVKGKVLRLINRERFGATPPSRDSWKGFLSSNSKCNTTGPDGLRCCHAYEIL